MVKKLIYMTLILCIITGCSATQETTKKFNEYLNQLEMSIQTNDWKQANKQVKKVKKQHDKELWKMQLLGEDRIYDNIQLSISHLKAAVKAENKKEIIKQTETIRFYVTEIFGKQKD
ncbi:hypothetical protein GCM10008986_12080 [Salinibacillus aidingensis]|uniref:DUF4363 family protein n=2 Tax=Salinibacillus aidingensis TaxID=237684 RepID=A0ABP3KY50_9BACI